MSWLPRPRCLNGFPMEKRQDLEPGHDEGLAAYWLRHVMENADYIGTEVAYHESTVLGRTETPERRVFLLVSVSQYAFNRLCQVGADCDLEDTGDREPQPASNAASAI